MPSFAKIFIAGFLCFNIVVAQNSIDEQIEFANKLFVSNQYFDAITEYKRLLFFRPDSVLHSYIYSHIALCYKAGAHFEEAIKYFSLAEKSSANDSISFSKKIEIIRCNILRKSTARALQLADDLETNLSYLSKKDEINYWRGWAHMFSGDWEKAENAFSEKEGQLELKKLCKQVIDDKVSVTFAKVISYILPGAGQIYSGKIFSGLMSLAWNFSAGYFTINAFMANRAFDGIVIAELVWLRFYKGNLENAEKFAVEKNLKIANNALEYLQNEYKGQKP